MKLKTLKAALLRILIAISLIWAIGMTLALGLIIQGQERSDRSEAFRGRHFGLVSEGMSVLQDELSATNVRLSKIKNELKKANVPEPVILRSGKG